MTGETRSIVVVMSELMQQPLQRWLALHGLTLVHAGPGDGPDRFIVVAGKTVDMCERCGHPIHDGTQHTCYPVTPYRLTP